MRFLLSALGSAGDVHPFIAIAQALIARGHRATVLASPHFEERIRRAGVDFAAFGAAGDYERLLTRPELWQPRHAARFILDELLDHLPEAYATTAALAAPQTVLVGSTLSWAVRLVQEKTGLPGATVHLSPLCLWSADDPAVWPLVGDLRWLPRPVRRVLLAAIDRFLIDRLVAPRLNALRSRLGLSPVRRIWSRWIHSPQLVIGAWPARFAAPQADWPPHAVAAGFPLFDKGSSGLDEALSAFLAAGPAPIGITPGSAMAHGRVFIERALAACAATGQRAVVVTPYGDQLPAQRAASAHHVAYAPFAALLPRLSALIHHGGIGTAAQALAAGIPQLVAPFAHDQFDNAARLARLGVGRTVAVDAPVARWTTTLAALMADAAVTRQVEAERERLEESGSAADTIAARLETLGARHVLHDERGSTADNAGPRTHPTSTA